MTFAEALHSEQFVVTAELSPPRGADGEAVRRAAAILRDWVDAANITDNQGAVMRMSSLAGSYLALQAGVEPVMQLVCRDRNRMALQSDLLGAGALGIPNVLLLTGDHPRFGDHPEARAVFDLDSVQLIWLARTMRDRAETLSGKKLTIAPRLLIGCVENPFAPPLRFRAERLAKKVAAGADFVQTQYIFDVKVFERWIDESRELGLLTRCAVLAGIGPIRSMRALERMRQIPGIVIPDEIERRLRSVPSDRVFDESVNICCELIAELRSISGVRGIHIMAFGNEEAVPLILERSNVGDREARSLRPRAAVR